MHFGVEFYEKERSDRRRFAWHASFGDRVLGAGVGHILLRCRDHLYGDCSRAVR